MDQFFGDPACWQLGAAEIRLRSGETHVNQCHNPLLPSQMGRGETVLELNVVEGLLWMKYINFSPFCWSLMWSLTNI